MSWPATSRYQLDAAPGSLAFVQDFVNSIPAGKPRGADLLAGLPDAQAWLDDAIARWRQSRGVAANDVVLHEADLVRLRAIRAELVSRIRARTASADGLRFVVPVRSVQAGPNPRYFGVGRGVTYFNWTSDQWTQFSAVVVSGTLRDSQFVLDGLLNNTSPLHPRAVAADTAADSDLIHGLFRLLGYQFSPRLADLPDRRNWRLDRHADYGPLNRLAVYRINRGES